MNNVTEIKNCRACGEKFPANNVFSLGVMPVVSFPDRADAPQINAPLDLVECPRCTLVQLRHTVDPDCMFRNYWYRSGVSATMRAALKDVVDSAQKFVSLKTRDAVCDIGCNDGTLLRFYPENMFRVGYEPCLELAKYANEHGVTTVHTYFTRPDIYWEHQFKIITACGMFYDLSDPGQFLEDVKWALAPGGIFIVQMNYLGSMLSNLALDNIEHEHLCYYSEKSFNLLCESHGMALVRIETNDVNGGSVRFYIQKGRDSDPFCEGWIASENTILAQAHWQNFSTQLNEMREKVQEYIEAHEIDRRGICGASTRGLALLHYLKLGSNEFVCAGDRDPAKHGRFYGFTGIPIVSEEEARAKCDVMMVLPYHFASEIIEREKEWLAQGGELLIPLPKPKVVTKEGERFL